MILMSECPCCGHDVSVLATSCPHCGFPVVLYESMKGNVEAQSDDPLEFVAANPHTPTVILEMLSKDDNPNVRAWVAQNPSLNELLVCRLAEDEDERVRVAIASSPSLTDEMVEKLRDDALSTFRRDVIYALSKNPRVSEQMQFELDQDLAFIDSYTDAPSPEGEAYAEYLSGLDWMVRHGYLERDTSYPDNDDDSDIETMLESIPF